MKILITALLTAVVGLSLSGVAHADPERCFFVTGPNGQVLYTVCIPLP